MSAEGSELRPKVAVREGEVDFHGLSFLPDGSLLTILHAATDDADKLLIIDAETRTELMHLGSDGGASPMYSPSGHVVFSRFSSTDDALTTWALPFDAKAREVLGEAILLFEDGAHPSVSRKGSLVYVSNVRAQQSQLVRIGPDGHVGEPVGDVRRNLVDPALSPDGSQVAVSILESENQDIWIVDLESGLRQRATFARAEDRYPAWSPDGSMIAFSRMQRYDWLSPDNGLWLRPADGTSRETKLSPGSQPAFTTDGTMIVMNSLSVRAENDLLVVAVDGGTEPTPFLESSARTRGAVPSPDGRFVAFESTEAGAVDIFVVSFPDAGGKWQISSGGGSRPRWSRSGDSIYFVLRNELWRVPVVSGRALSVGSPRRVVSGTEAGIDFERGYDVSSDGTIVAVRELDRERPALTLVENWATILQRN
jgi:serine/threonine-protein kinase